MATVCNKLNYNYKIDSVQKKENYFSVLKSSFLSAKIEFIAKIKLFFFHKEVELNELHESTKKEISIQTDFSYSKDEKIQKTVNVKTYLKKIKTINSIVSSILNLGKSTFGQSFKIGEDLFSSFVAIYDLSTSDFRDIKSLSQNLYKVIKAVGFLICSILIYPFSATISTVKNIIKSINSLKDIILRLIKCYDIDDLKKIFFYLLVILKDLLFVFSVIFASFELTLIYLGVSLLINSTKAIQKMKQGEFLEAADYALRGVSNIRSSDAKISEIFNDSIVKNSAV